jgi:hypothetical protein
MKPKVGPLFLSDFGEVRLGAGPHAGDIMPIMYRAPETLLYIQWLLLKLLLKLLSFAHSHEPRCTHHAFDRMGLIN